MPILFDCPSCGRPLRLSRRYAGLRGKCPQCLASIAVPELEKTIVDITSSSVDLPALGRDDPLTNTLNDDERRRDDLMRFAESPRMGPIIELADEVECPRCAERIKAKAKVCRFCNTDFEAPPPRREERREERRDDSRRVRVVHHHHHAPRPSPTSPGLAAVLSFFWPGVGQVYTGRVVVGVLLLLASPLAWGITLLLLRGDAQQIALVIYVVCWLGQIFDAYAGATPATGESSEGWRLRRRRR